MIDFDTATREGATNVLFAASGAIAAVVILVMVLLYRRDMRRHREWVQENERYRARRREMLRQWRYDNRTICGKLQEEDE